MKKILVVFLVLALVAPLAAQKKPKTPKTPPAPAAGAAAAAPPNDDSRGAIRAELRALQTLFRVKTDTAADTATRNHLADLRDQVAVILDPRGAAR